LVLAGNIAGLRLVTITEVLIDGNT
jgi:hypothetical protein